MSSCAEWNRLTDCQRVQPVISAACERSSDWDRSIRETDAKTTRTWMPELERERRSEAIVWYVGLLESQEQENKLPAINWKSCQHFQFLFILHQDGALLLNQVLSADAECTMRVFARGTAQGGLEEKETKLVKNGEEDGKRRKGGTRQMKGNVKVKPCLQSQPPLVRHSIKETVV